MEVMIREVLIITHKIDHSSIAFAYMSQFLGNQPLTRRGGHQFFDGRLQFACSAVPCKVI